MKTLFTLAVSTLLATLLVAPAPALAVAPPPPATANFATERGQVFSLALDGQPLTRPVARVHVERLLPGRHWADFSMPTPYGPPLHFRTAVWLAPGLETSYVLVLRPGYGPQLRQVGAVALGQPQYGPSAYGPGTYGPGTYGNNYPTPQGDYPVAPQPGGPAYGGAPGGYYGGSPAPGGAAPGPYGNTPYGNPGGYGTAPAPGPTSPQGYDPNDSDLDPDAEGYYPAPPADSYLRPLPAADVQALTQTLRSRPFDDARLGIAKQALAQGSVRADELAQLIGTLSFDKSRIDLATYGYGHLSDPQNFYRVYDVLRFSSSIREVQQALGLPHN